MKTAGATNWSPRPNHFCDAAINCRGALMVVTFPDDSGDRIFRCKRRGLDDHSYRWNNTFSFGLGSWPPLLGNWSGSGHDGMAHSIRAQPLGFCETSDPPARLMQVSSCSAAQVGFPWFAIGRARGRTESAYSIPLPELGIYGIHHPRALRISRLSPLKSQAIKKMTP